MLVVYSVYPSDYLNHPGGWPDCDYPGTTLTIIAIILTILVDILTILGTIYTILTQFELIDNHGKVNMLLISVSRWVTGAEGISWDAISFKIKIYQAQKLTKLEHFEDNGYLWVSTVENLRFFLISGCHKLFYFLSMRIGNKKFSVIMRYCCEDIMSIFLVWKEN